MSEGIEVIRGFMVSSIAHTLVANMAATTTDKRIFFIYFLSNLQFTLLQSFFITLDVLHRRRINEQL